MPKNKPNSNQTEKFLLLALSLISVGLLVAIVYVWSNALGRGSVTKPGDFLKTETPQSSAETSTPSATTTDTDVKLSLSVSSPKDQELVSAKSLTVSGQTLPTANLTIIGGKEDIISQADEAGEFSEKITLEEGDNKITVTAFDENGNQTSQVLTVIYAP